MIGQETMVRWAGTRRRREHGRSRHGLAVAQGPRAAPRVHPGGHLIGCFMVFAAATFGTLAFVQPLAGASLEGRHVDYHAIYDVWWDVACDTDLDGGDRRCYVQYVDPYRKPPNFRAAMVDVVYHASSLPGGPGEPVVTFDLEPGLSFDEGKLALVDAAGGVTPIALPACPGAKCIVSGEAASRMLANWRGGQALRLEIAEHNGERVVRDWPLTSIGRILDDFAMQRRERRLP